MASYATIHLEKKTNYTTGGAFYLTIELNGAPLPLAGAQASMVVRDTTSGKIIEHLTTENDLLQIYDENNGILYGPERFFNYPNIDKIYGFDVRIKLPGDIYKTYVKGDFLMEATYQKPVE